jgi:hypothetical protein
MNLCLSAQRRHFAVGPVQLICISALINDVARMTDAVYEIRNGTGLSHLIHRMAGIR